jgi:hypothetical protein
MLMRKRCTITGSTLRPRSPAGRGDRRDLPADLAVARERHDRAGDSQGVPAGGRCAAPAG